MPIIKRLIASSLILSLLGSVVGIGEIYAASNIMGAQKYAEDQWDGYIDLLHNTTDGVEVTSTQVLGKMWLENYGWLDMQPPGGGVTNTISIVGGNPQGTLSGKAWGEHIGWVEFGTYDNGSGPVSGVFIDSDGYFHGTAWAEGIGFLAFGDAMQGTTTYTESGDKGVTWARVNWSSVTGSTPTIVITAPTKVSTSNITDTTVRVTDTDAGVLAASVVVDSSTSLSHTGFNCTQTSGTQVDCTITITGTSGGNSLVIQATNQLGGVATETETGYDIDPDGDSDGDGCSDAWEDTHGFDKNDPSDAALDPDNDRLTNLQECSAYNTDPNNADTDNDLLKDGCEVLDAYMDPLNPNSDSTATGDNETGGVNDGQEDLDGDGMTNVEECNYNYSGEQKHTNPIDSDTDDDGLSDNTEFRTTGTNANKADTEGDGMPDGWEVGVGLQPLVNDSKENPDGDLCINIQEYLQGKHPFRASDCKEELKEESTDGSVNAIFRNYARAKGLNREETAALLKIEWSSPKNFEENYAKSLEIAQFMNEGGAGKMVTYVDSAGNERFAGYQIGKRGATEFDRDAQKLVYRRNKRVDENFLTSAIEPEFRPKFTVMNAKDIELDDQNYMDVVAINSMGLVTPDKQNEFNPRDKLTWEEFLAALLWVEEEKLLEYDAIKDMEPLTSLPIRNDHRSKVFYTALRSGLINEDFEVNTPLTRAVVVRELAARLELNLSRAQTDQAFKDIGSADALYPIIQAANRQRWFDNTRLSLFLPEREVTRVLFASWFMQALGERNPLADTPSFNTARGNLDKLYDDVYKIDEEDSDANPYNRRRSLRSDADGLSEAELAARARRMKEERQAGRSAFGPSRNDLRAGGTVDEYVENQENVDKNGNEYKLQNGKWFRRDAGKRIWDDTRFTTEQYKTVEDIIKHFESR